MATSILYRFSALALAALLCACGGGGDATPPAERITSSATLTPITSSEVSFTPSFDGYYQIVADADLFVENTSNDDISIDVDVRIHEIGTLSSYIVGQRTVATITGGEYWSGHTTASGTHYLFAGTTYRFVVFAVNGRQSSVAVDITNAKIMIQADNSTE